MFFETIFLAPHCQDDKKSLSFFLQKVEEQKIYFKKIQERINSFILDHCDIKEQKLMELMMENNDINFTMKESL